MPLSAHGIDIEKYDHIIWDWNGTLLDDVDLCIDVIGRLLAIQDIPLPSRDEYREIFGFPVQGYYEQLGFDFERTTFEVLADKYIADYDSRAHTAPLHDAAIGVLKALDTLGKHQSILSAAREAHVVEMVAHFGLQDYFADIYGIPDHHARSKRARGLELIEAAHIPPERTSMIGDTDHDHEVGVAMGVDVLLVAHGHQSEARLRAVHDKVAPRL